MGGANCQQVVKFLSLHDRNRTETVILQIVDKLETSCRVQMVTVLIQPALW